jgi:hypothetical protein
VILPNTGAAPRPDHARYALWITLASIAGLIAMATMLRGFGMRGGRR